MYPYHNDEDCDQDYVYQSLSNYGVCKSRWKRWNFDSNLVYDNLLSVDEQKKLVDDYTKKQEIDNPVNLFECVSQFYKSKWYKTRFKYNKILNEQNYWFWRRHFLQYTPVLADDEKKQNAYSIRIPIRHPSGVIDSTEDPQWWKYQIIDDGEYLHSLIDEFESEEEEEEEEEEDSDLFHDNDPNSIYWDRQLLIQQQGDEQEAIQQQQQQQFAMMIDNNDNPSNSSSDNYNEVCSEEKADNPEDEETRR